MASQEIGVAVIGFGLAGRVFHAPFVSAVPGLRLRTIVQRHGEEAARAYPEATTGVRVVRSIEEALADKGIELVVVGTPNDTHFPVAKAALEADKHVVVDKPLTGTSDETLELARLAQARRRVLAPFHNRRWDGDFKTVASLLKQGRLGRLVSFQSRFDRFRPEGKPGSWKETESASHGILYDLGPHLIDQALVLFGTPRFVTASVRRERDQTVVEDAFDLVLDFEVVRAQLGATVLAAEPSPRFLLHGTRGSYRKYGVDPQEPALVAGASVPRAGTETNWLHEEEKDWGTLREIETESPLALSTQSVPTERGDYRDFYANVRDAIQADTPLAVTPMDAWRMLRILELARQSSDERRTLPVDLTPPAIA